MQIIWSELAQAGLARHVPNEKRQAVERWIEAKLRVDPWTHGRQIPLSKNARVDVVYAGVRIRYLFDFDDQRVRILSVSRSSD